jgi:hypothetical protein
MKFAAPLSLLGLASASPLSEKIHVVSNAQDATVTSDAPVWAWSSDYISEPYYGFFWHYTMTLEEVPNAGENAMDICNGISMAAEAWCPQSELHAKQVYSELVVRNFMPNSFANGVLDESELDNIPSSLATGYRTKTWGSLTIPEPIDNVDATTNRGNGGANDVYACGPSWGDDSYLQSLTVPTIGFIDDTASAPNHCTALGMHNGYGDSFDDFKLKNVDCADTHYIICADMWLPVGGSSHGGFPVVGAEMNNTQIDIMKAAFDKLYDPANQPVEEEEVTDGGDSGATDSGATETDSEKSGMSKKTKIIALVAIVVVAIIAFVALKK